MVIRKALLKDLDKLKDIYNYEVLNGTATFDIGEKDYEDRLIWFNEHTGSHPLIVAEVDKEVAGFASLSTYRSRAAFNGTVELSLYIDVSKRKMGIATKLMEHILNLARIDENIHTVVSVITSENEVSIRLHEKFGFIKCGEIKEVGKKFGRYLGTTIMQIMV